MLGDTIRETKNTYRLGLIHWHDAWDMTFMAIDANWEKVKPANRMAVLEAFALALDTLDVASE